MAVVVTAADGGAVAAGSCGGACVRGAQRWLRSWGRRAAFAADVAVAWLARAESCSMRRWRTMGQASSRGGGVRSLVVAAAVARGGWPEGAARSERSECAAQQVTLWESAPWESALWESALWESARWESALWESALWERALRQV